MLQIKIRVQEESMTQNFDIDYDEDNQYVIGYSIGMHHEERLNYKKEARGLTVTKKEPYLLRKNQKKVYL